jgi:uncharacterized protein YjiK
MPWPFGPDEMGDSAGDSAGRDLNRHDRRQKWRKQRRSAKHEAAPAARPAANPVLFESYEPRLLLSGVPVGTVLASGTGSADFQDADGTKVTATLTGPGQFQVVQGAALPTLLITGTDATSTFTLGGAGGNGRVNLEGVTLSGPMASFTASSTDPVSSFTVQGAVQSIVLGNVRDMVLSSTAAIGSVAVESWQSGGVVANGIVAPSLGSLESAGQLNMSMTLTSLDLALGSVLAGALTGGMWQVAGDIGTIAVRSVGAGWSADVVGRTGTVATGGIFSGTLATKAIDVFAVGGSLVNAHLMVGATLGADGKLGGSGADADTFGAGFIGQLRVAGAVIGARIHVGVDPVNGVFDDGDDVVRGGSASRIQTLMVGGRIDSTSRIVTGVLPPSFFAGGRSYTPAGAPRTLATSPGDRTLPTLSAALVNDTGPSATDRVTADVAVSGSATDAGGIVALRGGLDGTPAADFTDLVLFLDAQGGFTLTADDMAELAGGTLAEGPHVLHLVAVDASGNTRTLDLRFTYSNTQISAALANDTGVSASDGITADYAVSGTVTGGVAIESALVGLDKAADTALTLGGAGAFSLSKAEMDALAGGAVGQGAHVLHLAVTDANGITTTRELAFTYDSVAPKIGSFGLTASSDTGTAGDNITAAARVGLLGSADGAAMAMLGDAKALVAANGGFQFADVVLIDGDNKLSLTVSDLAGNTATTTLTVNRSGSVSADAAITWNQATLEAVRRASMYPETATRIMAMVGIAQFDTLAAIEGSAAFLVKQDFSGEIDTGLALAKAAHAVLYAAFPNQRTSLDEILATAMAAVPDGVAKTNALALGGSIGQAVVDIRAADGSANYVEYLASETPGRWRPTAPSYEVAEEPQWAELTPFALASASQFQLPPPPDLTSAEYAAAVAEVRELGSATSATRTADQAQQAQFWADGRGSYTPPGHWNQIAQQIAQSQGNSLAANVRLFAKLNVALADAAIASWNTKFAYSLWRPIDAIQQADLDGNAATTKDEAWLPLLITPPHPEYVSGHSTFSAAAATVLQASFGDVAFSTNSFTLPGVTRNYTSFQQAVDEAGRSRIYGGIHFEFSNEGGKTLGAQVAGAALARFNLSQDTQGPNVVASILPGVTNKNVTVAGQVLDNLSGVSEASYSIDGGPAQALTLDGQGRYSIATEFALDGTQDALHTISISAKDVAGNAAKTVVRSFRLDTRLPVMSLASLAEGDSFSSTSRLTGVAGPTGSTLSKLTYSFDKGPATSIGFDSTTGAYDAGLNLGDLDIGAHTLTITATDAGGNTATLTRGVTLSALAPFQLTAISPTAGESDVGSTERPEIRFSRAVKIDTLTADSFYASAADGTKLAGTIVPAQDGSSAMLFLDAPMPGGATITVTVDGSRIRAATDGAFLDADLNGVAGGLRQVSFTTVSLTTVAGTVLRGRVVDPGPDLQPMTFDDMRRGPDGVIFTPDDVFLNPIAHAKVYVLGMEDRFVFTDENGFFEMTDLPAGTVKVAVDGRTATNAPVGVFWPEMVMDSELRPGEVNTLMDTMGSAEERASHAGRLEVYLPRVATTIFSLVSESVPTTVGVDQNSAPNLTDSQRGALTLTVDPGSIIGADGQPLTDAQIGLSTVPPELVRDMLPPGVLQHTFDITIQAPGAATFSTPATISFPNVFGAAPGTKLNILSFDHTTGMLVINGTATVSEDGLTVVSDEGAGVRAPGWHGITPPGGCNPAGGAPPDPVPPSKDEKVNEHAPQALTFLTASAAADNFTALQWNAPQPNKALPPLPPIPGCEVPPHNPDTKTQPFISVTIEVDGALGQFAKPVNGSLDLVSQSFTLSAGTGITKKFDFDPKTYAEMFKGGNGFADLNNDQLYGARIKITEIRQNADGSRTRDIYTYYQNRFVAAVEESSAAKQSGDLMAFFRANTDGVVRTNKVELFLPNSVKTSFTGGGAPFTLAGDYSGNATLVGKFDPDKAGYDQKSAFNVQVSDAKGALTVGSVTAVGTGTAPTKISVDEAGYRTELSRALKAVSLVTLPGADKAFGTKDDTTRYLYDYGGGIGPMTLPGKDAKLGTADDVTINVVNVVNKVGLVGASFLAEFAAFLPDKAYTAKDFSTMLDKQVAAMKTAVLEDYAPTGKQYQVVAANAGADVTMSWQDTFFGAAKSLVYGFADFDRAQKYMATYLGLRPDGGKGATIGQAALEHAIAEGLNIKVANSGQFGVAINFNWDSPASFAQYVANTVSHELAHTFGLNDAYVDIPGKGSPPVNPPNDIMRSGNSKDGNLNFAATNLALLQAALGIQPDGQTPITAAVKEYRTNFNLPGSLKGAREGINDLTTPILHAGWAGGDLGAGTTVSFAATAADGAGGATRTVDVTLSNVGFDTLSLDGISLGSGANGFSILTPGLAGTTLAQDASVTLTLAFDPTAVGNANDTLTIKTNSDFGALTFDLSGTGIAATARAVASSGVNNFGGMTVGSPAASLNGLFSIANTGATPLSITEIRLVEGGAEFALLGVPLDLKSSPASIGLGDSFSFGLSYAASALGLQRAVVEVVTNDPTQPVLRLGAVGTGISALPTAAWGQDYVGIQVTTPNNPPALHAVSDDKGFFSFFLPNNSPYHMAVFDPATGLVAHDYGKTADSGKGVNLTATLVFGASLERDSDYDGLPDDIEFTIDSNPRSADTNKDGISDFAAIRQGLSPLGDLGTPTGVVGATTLQGSANGVAVIGSTTDPTKLTAFVATGNAGLAVVDVSKITAPSVLAELDLTGENTRVAVDSDRGVAAIAGGGGGLHLVDVANPAAPVLIRDVMLAAPVASVAVRDGIAYAVAGTSLSAVDINTGDVRTVLEPGGTLVDVAIEGDVLYTLNSAGVVRAISIDGDELTLRGQVTMPQTGSRITVGGGVAYVAAYTGGLAGFMTADIKDPDALSVLSGVDSTGIAGTAIALTGTGRAVAVGGNDFVFGAFRRLDVVDVTDPADTGALDVSYNLPELARDVAIANGVAFVADAKAGLQIVNYMGFDTKGVAPTVTIAVSAGDADPATPGIQVLAGGSVHVTPLVSDDVQIRNVELLVNGKVVSNDPSFPFDMFTQAPTIGGSVQLQVRVTDTGGNVGLSDVVTLATVPDTFGPTVLSTSIADGDKRFFVRNIDVRFNEQVDAALLNGGGISLIGLGADGKFGTADDVTVATKIDTRAQGRAVSVLPQTVLLPGEYRFRVETSAVADLSGNALGTALERSFTVRPASDVKAASGTPSVAQAPSANPGQEIGIAVPFDPTTAFITFATINESGTVSTAEVKVTRTDAANSTAYFVVPNNAFTGDVVVYGKESGGKRTDFADGTFLLQVVPLLTDARIDFLNGDGTMRVSLDGRGFVEGNDTVYTFGTEQVIDTAANTGPDATYSYVPNYTENSRTYLSVPMVDGAFGAITVKTAGGTSAAYSVNLSGVAATALSGTPANAALPSANAGQAITLSGAGLDAETKLLFRRTSSYDGAVQYDLQTAVAAAPNGTGATVLVPKSANGVFALQVLGAAVQPVLQIVPTIQSYDVSSHLYVYGSGFVEGALTAKFAGGEQKDTATNVQPSPGADVYSRDGFDNGVVRLDGEPVHGFGPMTISTAGGTSAPFALNELTQGFGNLRDVAFDPATNSAWVVNYPGASPSALRRLDLATGAELQSIPLTVKDFGSTQITVAGLQMAPETFTLNGASIPAGSLLVFNGEPNTDRVIALNPATGAVLASLTLKANYDLTSGLYDPTTKHLLLTERNSSARRLLEIDPADGAEISSLPIDYAEERGLAIDPVTGNLWLAGTSTPSVLVEMTRSGTQVRQINIGLQGVNDSEVSGLSFDDTGKLLVSSTQGRIYSVDVNADPAAAARPTLTSITGLALGGVPADAGKASANVGQVITLTGSQFGPQTQVVFPTRDQEGRTGLVSVVPLAINDAGTQMQVLVPDLTTTGEVRVSNAAYRNLGFSSHPDAIYRSITLSFTAADTGSTIRFSDGGLQSIDDESWGLDNVRVTQGKSEVFSDTFETGVSPAWSNAAVDRSNPSVFTAFSGRFGNNEQRLSLSGLTAGQTYTLSFDLYAFDSWDGTAGGDVFQVSADGTLLMRESISNYALTVPQTINSSAGMRLQVVPTLTSVEGSWRPGSDTSFTLRGSGFMEGVSKVTIGGVTIVDEAGSFSTRFGVSGTRNDTGFMVAPLVLEGPIKVTTEGGSAEIAGPLDTAPTAVVTGIAATAAESTPNVLGQASANVGQAIKLLGQGFTTGMRVAFAATDDTGREGTVTRAGIANAAGTELSVQVPALARTGVVRLAGAAGGQMLQVVPTLRSVGGTVAAGNTLLVEGTGLVASELVVQAGGRTIGNFTVRTLADSTSPDATYSFGGNLSQATNQQLLTIVLPSGVAGSDVTVSTVGGTATLRTGISVANLTLTPVADVGETLATALGLGLQTAQSVSVSAVMGDGTYVAKDVDLFRVDLQAGDVLRYAVNGTFNAYVRLFNGAGKEVQTSYSEQKDAVTASYTVAAAGDYYVGISGYGNYSYDPMVEGSADSSFYSSAAYVLTMDRTGRGDSRLSGIDATAALGTPAQAGVASANARQAITLLGSGLQAGEQVVFTRLDESGQVSTVTATPTLVAEDGKSLSVVVPESATTGMVRLVRDQAGVLLQVVPTLSAATMFDGSYVGGNLTLTGTGFAEGMSTIGFGSKSVADSSRSSGIEISSAFDTRTIPNASATISPREGFPTGPIRITTPGGTSNTLNQSLAAIVATAESGTPADAGKASANPGQSITLSGVGLSARSDVVFDRISSDGTRSQVVTTPWSVDMSGTSIKVVVPADAVTGSVRLIGDGKATSLFLQVVPKLTSADMTSIDSDGAFASITLQGAGFVEGNGTEYRFGAVIRSDGNTNSDGADVYGNNTVVNLRVPLADSFGPITVKTEGGTTAPFSVGFSSLQATALSGTPAQAKYASANPGQTVTLTGEGLGIGTDVVFRTIGSYYGETVHRILNPIYAAPDGKTAILQLPKDANGAFALQILGSGLQPMLQIVPTIESYDVSNHLYVYGSGFVEGALTAKFAGGEQKDTATNVQPSPGADVYGRDGFDSGAVRLDGEPVHGFGPLTITTAGGTSAPFALNELTQGFGNLRDVAFDPTTKSAWVVNYPGASASALRRLDLATGAELQSIPFTVKDFGSTQLTVGALQITDEAFTLNGASIPVGSLLLFNGDPNTDRIIALNPADGSVLGSLTLKGNYDTTAGLYDATSNHLFVLDRSQNPRKILEIDPADGTVLSSFNSPLWGDEAGFAIDPVTGDLWMGSYNDTSTLVEFSRTGTEVRRINLASQGITDAEISGLAFDDAGRLLVSSTQGRVYRVDVNADPVAISTPTLSAITGAALGGVPADAGKASANVNQIITLTGTQFGPGTRVLFPTVDENGTPSLVSVAPLQVNQAGTQLLVKVPSLAVTGAVQVTNGAFANYGFASYPDAAYRGITLSFTAGSTTSVIRFNDLGLEGGGSPGNESWGIDNVKVAQGKSTVFADTFETGASKAWSDARVDTTLASTFSAFSGRYSSDQQLLSLNGLTAGQTYTLSFDLYAFDSWDGEASPNYGRDVFQVSADGKVLMSESIGNFGPETPQTINRSAGVPLQIVPTLTGTANGRPGIDGGFDLTGSGFIEGASTITLGGIAFVDTRVDATSYYYYTDGNGPEVLGNNDQYRLTAPLALDGPIRITTAGGYAEIAGVTASAVAPVQFAGLLASAPSYGVPAGTASAAANAGQTITLVGNGFTNNTLVQFEAVDSTGAVGTVTRQGQVDPFGTRLTVAVPAQARSGLVRVIGAAESHALQVVPWVRGLGGTIAEGNTLVIDGSGFVPGEVSVLVDGIPATIQGITLVADGTSGSVSTNAAALTTQQLLRVTVPAGASNAAVTVTTAGGQGSSRRAVFTTADNIVPSGDVGDTIADSTQVSLALHQSVTISQQLGNGSFGDRDVDLYRVDLGTGDLLQVQMASGTLATVRVFDAAGSEKTSQALAYSGTEPLTFSAPVAGAYYVGITGYQNASYDPNTAGSGNSSFYSGNYTTRMVRLAGSDTRLTGITALAGTGTPTTSGVASANPGQTITLTGTGLDASDRVVFVATDSGGYISTTAVTPTNVAGDGTSFNVVVPTTAATGTVRLARDVGGLFLQVVPVLSDVVAQTNQGFVGGSFQLSGKGFVEGGSTVNFGAQKVADTARSQGFDITQSFSGSNLSMTVPDGVPGGPISVTTAGGTSNVFGLAITGLTASATSGTPADAGHASANPGQTITITGTGLDATLDIVFQVNDGGTPLQLVVRPTSVAEDGTSAQVVVPAQAETGVVRVVGDSNATETFLQIVPVVSGIVLNGVSSDSQFMDVSVLGGGFIDREGTQYRFGTTPVEDPGAGYGQGPDVTSNAGQQNGLARMVVPMRNESFGPIVVRTAGGTSAAYSLDVSGITATAATGTPANAGAASANPGQAITVNGTDLTTGLRAILRYRDSYSAALQFVMLSPSAVAEDGSTATLTVPQSANGAFELWIPGASAKPLLQVVPTIQSYDVSNHLYIYGAGFVEGGLTAKFAGGEQKDTATNVQPNPGADVYNRDGFDNGAVRLDGEPVHGFGPLTITTAGGTSAPFALNELTQGFGNLRDVAFDPTTKSAWVVNYPGTFPTALRRLDLATGTELQSIAVTTKDFGSTQITIGALQITDEAFTLNGATIPVGSLLVFNGEPNTDRVIALNPADGSVLGSLTLKGNYDLTAGLYDATSNHLFVNVRNQSPRQVLEIDPTDGTVLASFNSPLWGDEAGFAVDPVTGNLWMGSYNDTSTLVEFTRTGTEVRRISLASQGINDAEISGLSFDDTGKLLVSSTQGRVYRVTV